MLQVEVDLCGYVILVMVWVLIYKFDDVFLVLCFVICSGELSVWCEGDLLVMDFLVKCLEFCVILDGLLEVLGIVEVEVLKIDDYFVVVDDEKMIVVLVFDFVWLKGLLCCGVVVIVCSQCFDFVLCWFGFNVGVNEDLVIGFVYIFLVLYWVQCLGKIWLSVEQGGVCKGCLECDVCGEWVVIFGKVVLYMSGMFYF